MTWIGAIRVLRYHLVHEVEELAAPPPRVVAGLDQAAGHFQGGEQCGGAVTLVAVREAGQRFAIGQAQPALRALQRLDRGLLVHGDHDRIWDGGFR